MQYAVIDISAVLLLTKWIRRIIKENRLIKTKGLTCSESNSTASDEKNEKKKKKKKATEIKGLKMAGFKLFVKLILKVSLHDMLDHVVLSQVLLTVWPSHVTTCVLVFGHYHGLVKSFFLLVLLVVEMK